MFEAKSELDEWTKLYLLWQGNPFRDRQQQQTHSCVAFNYFSRDGSGRAECTPGVNIVMSWENNFLNL